MLLGPRPRRQITGRGNTLLTPDRTRTAANEQREHPLASTRLVIEASSPPQRTDPTRTPSRPRARGSHSESRDKSSPHTRNPAQHPQRPPHTRPSPPTTAAKSHQVSS